MDEEKDSSKIQEYDTIELTINPPEERLQFWNKKPVSSGMIGTVIDIYSTKEDFCVEIHDPESEYGEWIALIDVNISEIKKVGRNYVWKKEKVNSIS